MAAPPWAVPADGVNSAGRLRMPSQRSAKAWLMLVDGCCRTGRKSILIGPVPGVLLTRAGQICGPGDERIRGLAQARQFELVAPTARCSPTSAATRLVSDPQRGDAFAAASSPWPGLRAAAGTAWRLVNLAGASACCPSGWRRPTCSARWGPIAAGRVEHARHRDEASSPRLHETLKTAPEHRPDPRELGLVGAAVVLLPER